MKRHPALIELSRDHHKGLLLAQLMKKDAPPYKGLPTDPAGKCAYFHAEFEVKLKAHFEEEEKILFPNVSSASVEIKQLCEELIEEHQQLYTLKTQLNPEKPDTTIMHEAGRLLEQHIRKEERVLFQKIQETLSKDALNELGEKLKRNNQSGQYC